VKLDLSRTIDISAAPTDVWAVWSDVARWPEWNAAVANVEVLGPAAGEISVGMRVRIRQPKFPTAIWRVTLVDVPNSFEWVAESPGARVTGVHQIAAKADGGTTATMGLRFEGPIARFVAWISRSLTERNLGLEAAGLKRQSETHARQSGA
jgi:hypothetical protein